MSTPVVPKKAAACILVRHTPEFQVLLAQRNKSLRFMAGHHVFPGGRIDDDEGDAHVINADSPDRAAAVHAVAREVFEETGILCVEGDLPPREAAREWRRKIIEDRKQFDAFLDEFGLTIDADRFERAGSWVTPPFSPIRFDTQYYLYHVPEGQTGELVPGEMIALDWLSPEEARRRWRRGEVHVSTPVAFVLQQFAAVGYPKAMAFLMRPSEREPGRHNRFEVRRGITVVPLKTRTIPPATHTNCVIVGEKELYVIDPGSLDSGELDHLRKQLDHFIELGGRITAVVLTHSHRDHVEGVPFVRDTYEVPVWAHEATGKQTPFPIDRFIADGEVLESAGEPPWRLRAIHTPGHDPGHLCFLEESTGTLICGDMMANPGTIVVSLEFGGDMTQFMQSLEKLMDVPAKLLLPSHGQLLGKPREKILEHLEHRRWREAKIKAALDSGADSIPALLAKVYDDVPETAHKFAEHALRAHLHRLGVEIGAKDPYPPI